MSRLPMVVAHRGASAEAPENTLAAFRLALQQGCDAIELDVHLSADEAVIVCHDETIDRTTDGTGAIAEMTAAEIREFDAGSWFGPSFAGERLPLLEEVLALVPRAVAINIEIKSDSHPNVCRRLAELLERTGRMDTVFFSSFGHPCMAEMKKLAPHARVGLLYEDEPIDYGAFFRNHGIQGFSLHPFHEFVTPSYVGAAARNGLEVHAWTVDDPARMLELADCGVAGIITNRPKLLRELLGARKG